MSSKIRQFKRQDTKPEGITVTLAELLACQDGLKALLAKDVPITKALQLIKTVKACGVEIEQYDAAKRLLLDRYVEKKDETYQTVDGGGLKFLKGKTQADLDREHAELIATEVTLPGKKIKTQELQGVTIAAEQLQFLTWLLDD